MSDCMVEQSAPVKSVYCSKGYNNYDSTTTMRSRKNVATSAGLNKATCVMNCEFACAVKNKQGAVRRQKRGEIKCVTRIIFRGCSTN